MSTASKFGAAPLLDIVSFGYRKLIHALLPLTGFYALYAILGTLIIGAPFGVLVAMGVGLGNSAGNTDAAGLLVLLGFVALFIYAMIVFWLLWTHAQITTLSFTQDLLEEREQPSFLQRFLTVDERYWQLLMFNLLWMGIWIGLSVAYGIFAIISYFIIIFGFILLIIPGVIAVILFLAASLAFYSYVLYIYLNTSYAFLTDPKQGIFAAITQGFRLTVNNVWRGIGAFAIVYLINLVLQGPLLALNWVLSFSSSFASTVEVSILMISGYLVYYAVTYWFAYVVGFGAAAFIGYRLFCDLKARHQQGTDTPQQAPHLS